MKPSLYEYSIPFNHSSLTGNELAYIAETMERGQIAGNQAFSQRCQAILERTLNVPRTLVTSSCTHALEMAGLLLNIQSGDEVIVPAFTFVSTANAFVLRGARPIFCDIRPDTLNLDEELLEQLVGPRTRAIIPVHYAGVGCEMDRIMAIAEQYGVPVVEDNAHGLFGKYKGRWLGTFGALSTLSFHETKNITCGEGGALLINASRLVDRAEIIREKGTNRASFFRGQVDKYSWIDVGSSYVMSDVLAAFLCAQLESWQSIQAKRRALWQRYHGSLASWCVRTGVRQPIVPLHCEQAWHMYYLLAPNLEMRTALLQHLKDRGIMAVFHYLPLNQSGYMHARTESRQSCPVTEFTSDCLFRLPFFNCLSEPQQSSVIEALLSFV